MGNGDGGHCELVGVERVETSHGCFRGIGTAREVLLSVHTHHSHCVTQDDAVLVLGKGRGPEDQDSARIQGDHTDIEGRFTRLCKIESLWSFTCNCN